MHCPLSLSKPPEDTFHPPNTSSNAVSFPDLSEHEAQQPDTILSYSISIPHATNGPTKQSPPQKGRRRRRQPLSRPSRLVLHWQWHQAQGQFVQIDARG